MGDQQSGLEISSPEELSELIGERTDAEIESVLAELGLDDALAHVFESMQERFLPEPAAGQRALIQWCLATTEGIRNYYVDIADGRCRAVLGTVPFPRVKLECTLAVFLRLISGRLAGLQAFSNGQLVVTGDQTVALAQQIWFEADFSQAKLEISTPTELRRLIAGRRDEEINAGVATTGIDQALEDVFAGMVEHFLPNKAGRRAVVEFRLRTNAGDRTYQFRHEAGRASYSVGSRDKSNVALTVSFPDFLRLVAGELNAILALTSGKLKVRGNVLMARKIQTWFDQTR